MNVKWWGWGDPAKTFKLDHRPHFWPYLKAKLQRDAFPSRPVISFEQIELSPSRLNEDAIAHLRTFANLDVETSHEARISHAYGKSYRDLVRIRQGVISSPPDAVLFPKTHETVEQILAWAQEHHVSIVPFGGGTSVVGGVEHTGDRPSLTLSLAQMNRIISIDERSLTATVQAGMLGPKLEAELQAKGFTLGHYPQSFEFSTIGGWIVTRSAGQQSTRYGKIEDMVQAVSIATPTGALTTLKTPASSAGPDLARFFCGSEGVLGILTEATVRIHRLPQSRYHGGCFFSSWSAGAEAVRRLTQSEISLATVRLSDPHETEALFKLREVNPAPAQQIISKAARWYITNVKKAPLSTGCLLILGFEGDHAEVDSARSQAAQIVKQCEGVDLGPALGRAWFKGRFDLPYLRDTMLDHGVLVDTLETATTWENFHSLYDAVREALHSAISADRLSGIVLCHISHPYSDGASLYYTFITPQVEGQELLQWQQLKTAASEAITKHKGTISHHHGVGMDHRQWLEPELGDRGQAMLAGMKHVLDPSGILNPGKLIP